MADESRPVILTPPVLEQTAASPRPKLLKKRAESQLAALRLVFPTFAERKNVGFEWLYNCLMKLGNGVPINTRRCGFR